MNDFQNMTASQLMTGKNMTRFQMKLRCLELAVAYGNHTRPVELAARMLEFLDGNAKKAVAADIEENGVFDQRLPQQYFRK